MLRVFPDSTSDGVDESLGFAQALAKEGFKSPPANRNVSLVLYFTLVLLSAEQDNIFQDGSRKWNSVQICGNSDGKVIFALLEKIVTLQASFILINVREPGFQRSLTWAFIVRSSGNNKGQNRCRRSRIQNGSEDLLEVILQIFNHGRVGGAKSNKWSNNRCNSKSRSMCYSRSRGARVATLGGGCASKLIFAIVRILARIATSGRSSYQAGWVGAHERSYLISFQRAGWPVRFGALRIVNGQVSGNDSTSLIGGGCLA